MNTAADVNVTIQKLLKERMGWHGFERVEVHEGRDQRFDVLLPDGDRESVLLYAIYDDEQAFAAHCCSPHFHRLDATSKTLIEAKTMQRYRLVQEARP